MTTDQAPNRFTNKVFFKAFITGFLILIMLVPAQYVNNLVKEREQRQKQVVEEVSSKWATAQTFTGPYLVIPYSVSQPGKQPVTQKMILLPEELKVDGTVTPAQKHRSIYQVLLYKAKIECTGHFRFVLPENIPATNLKLGESRICIGISDFKGIEDKLQLQVNNIPHTLQPGLPTSEIDNSGFSAPLALTTTNLDTTLSFRLPLQLKGSSQLHFAPLAANSSFSLSSPWPSPSFDGSALPSLPADPGPDGFHATWNFNQANLPFPVAITTETVNKQALAFGLTMMEPADQYVKTLRCTKYAILFIGLSFALFFMVELMYKRPVHPLQYLLVGLALTVFYTLLLSISEFIQFDLAYLIATVATVSLISLYVKGYFGNWKIAGIFAGLLSALYGFIFILIRLEDTALLVGSIGLFVMLAIVMYISRRINWYGYAANS
ncbi:cell envelope integrity protein CreD [Filimonas effusa]|uniref:Cell envelope integrity protein CreD n=1 Tax=Filimonas effusa TaxID=2508721 RepID=A0A4Q1D5X4_9BACT|nr:cell envelope integrity protein CreD [Filimonas effusa]RXK83091.1 cell envelope integrity protein CreD [Filimonas effusa]